MSSERRAAKEDRSEPRRGERSTIKRKRKNYDCRLTKSAESAAKVCSLCLLTSSFRIRKSPIVNRQSPALLLLHRLVYDELAALFHGNDFVDRLKSRQRQVDDVIARIERHIERRVFLHDVLVDCNLRTFGQRVNADHGLPGLHAFSAKELRHLADRLDAVRVAQRLQRGREVKRLPQHELAVHGLVEITHLAHQHHMLAFSTLT